jgi:hypothetical protein
MTYKIVVESAREYSPLLAAKNFNSGFMFFPGKVLLHPDSLMEGTQR